MTTPLVNRGGTHDFMSPTDVLQTPAGKAFFVNGATPKLNLVEFNNVSPAEGDLWRYHGTIWVHVGGVTRALFPAPSS